MKPSKYVFFIDPQSYHNLSAYDYNLLSRIDCGSPIIFFASKRYEFGGIPGIEIKKIFNYSGKGGSVLKLLSYAASMLQVMLAVVHRRPAVIHAQWFKFQPFDVPFYRICQRCFGAKVILTAHDVLPHNLNMGLDKRSLRWIQKGFSICDKIIVHTEASRRDLLTTFNVDERKVSIVPHGLIESAVNPSVVASCKADFSRQYSLPGKTVFAMLGSSTKYKGADLIVKAWCESESLRNDGNSILILGKWVINDLPCETQLPENVIILSRSLTNEEFAALMQLTDVLLMPYRRIDQSGLLLTALSMGIPYCATNVGELTAPMRIADIGWRIPRTDDAALAAVIEHLAANRAEIAAKRNNAQGWEAVRQAYGWERSAQLTSSLYADLMGRTTPPPYWDSQLIIRLLRLDCCHAALTKRRAA